MIGRYRKGKRKWNSGVFTVEASVIVPAAVLLLALLLLLLFHIHNRMWYRCAVCESAVRGIERKPGSEGEAAAKRQADSRVRSQVMPGAKPEVRVFWSRERTEVYFRGGGISIGGYRVQAFSGVESADRVSPEKWLRTQRAAGRIREGINDTD